MRKIYNLLLAAVIATGAWAAASAEVPVSYYRSINGLADAQLKNALFRLLKNHTEVSSYSNLPTYFEKTDTRKHNGETVWWDMYSSLNIPTYYRFGSYMNREHSFPKSWWGGLTTTPAYVDLYHLYPAESAANMAKSNYPLGEVSSSSTPQFDNDVVKVGYATTGQGGGARFVFEPNDEYKGDFARTYFYVVTCYQDLTWTRSYMYMLEQNDYPTLKKWAYDLLLKWAREDPVSQKEIDRNEAVYKIQNNRNPFIDYPQLAEYIWGDKVGQKFYVGEEIPNGDPELITPVQDMALDFTQLALGSSDTERLAFIGQNLTGSLELFISGTDRAMFSIPTKTIAAKLVNADGGYSLPVTYTPTAIGSHTAKLIVSDGGLAGSRGIILKGECLERPNLTAPVALPPTDITEDSYVANWEVPSEVVDHYIVTRTRYINGSATSEDIIAEENSLLVEDFAASTSESYNVRSVALGVESPRSQEIFVEHAGVTGIEADKPFSCGYWQGGFKVLTGVEQTNMRVIDLAGRIIMTLPTAVNDDVILLPRGAYLIITDQCHTPVKILVD